MDYIRYYHIRIFTGGYLYILQIENNLKKIRWTIMLGLSKSEYQILYSLYDVNQSLTKHEILEKMPELNKNTAAVVIRSLFAKGYLEVGEIKYSQTVLARAYRPSIPFIDFIKGEYGETALEKLVNHAISSLMTKQQTEYFSNLINERKNMINKNS